MFTRQDSDNRRATKWQWKSNQVAMEEQPLTMWQWKSNHVAMEEQPLTMWQWKSNHVAMEEQQCGNGRAAMWQWKSNHAAMEEQPRGNGRATIRKVPSSELPLSCSSIATICASIGNGRAASCQQKRRLWQWKSRKVAVEEENSGSGKAALWH